MAFTSNLITNIPDPSGEKLKEYLRQMGQTADEMKRIINFYFTLPADSSPRERMRVSHYAK